MSAIVTTRGRAWLAGQQGTAFGSLGGRYGVHVGPGGAGVAPTVTLSSTSVSEDASIGTVVGTPSVSNLPDGVTVSSWAITADPDTKFDLDVSDDLITEATLDYETATSHSVTLEATLSDASTVSRTFSISVIDVLDTAPVNETAPSISGTPTFDETLTVVPGTWDDGDATLTYQWLRDAVNISGATASTYTLVEDDIDAEITVTETATNAFGSNSETSAAVGPVAGIAPENTALPTITGTEQVGETLSVSDGTWTGTPAPTFTYQWTRDGGDISGATSNTYVLVEADEGVMIACVVTGTNSEGTADATAAAVGPIANADTAPAQFGTDDWSVADAGTGGSITITITNLPDDGGSEITDLQYQIDGGTWTSLGDTATGNYNVSGLTDDVQVAVAVRAVNAVGAATASATKNVTPTDSGVFAPSLDFSDARNSQYAPLI